MHCLWDIEKPCTLGPSHKTSHLHLPPSLLNITSCQKSSNLKKVIQQHCASHQTCINCFVFFCFFFPLRAKQKQAANQKLTHYHLMELNMPNLLGKPDKADPACSDILHEFWVACVYLMKVLQYSCILFFNNLWIWPHKIIVCHHEAGYTGEGKAFRKSGGMVLRWTKTIFTASHDESTDL